MAMARPMDIAWMVLKQSDYETPVEQQSPYYPPPFRVAGNVHNARNRSSYDPRADPNAYNRCSMCEGQGMVYGIGTCPSCQGTGMTTAKGA